MKILHTVESYLPQRHGMQEVVTQLSENLVTFGHDVTIATKVDSNRTKRILNGVKIRAFKLSGNAVNGIEGDVDEYLNFVLNSKFDVVTNFAAQQWATDCVLPILNKLKAFKVFVPTGFSGLYLDQYQEYFQCMKEWMKEYNATVFLSKQYRDYKFAKENKLRNTVVIPNGASYSEFTEVDGIDIRELLGIRPAKKIILHVGSYTGIKGHIEAYEIFKKAGLDNAVLLFVGKGLSKVQQYVDKDKTLFSRLVGRYKEKQVYFAPLTRTETVAAFKQSDLFLFPSLLECSPIVLFECLASKTPFLANNVGNANEIAKTSKGGIILPGVEDSQGFFRPDIEEASILLENLVLNKHLVQKMALQGYEAWKKRFTWEQISLQYERLYQNGVEKHNIS